LRIFINDRKRHTRKGRKNNQNLTLPNKGRSRKEPSSRAPPIQLNPELSSQSSSADNGDPQTPSPQYRDSTSPAISTANNSQQIGDLDPHFARLLASLAMSGQKQEEKILVRSPKNPSSDVRPARRQSSPTTVGRRPPTANLGHRLEIDRDAKVDQTTANIPESSLNLSTASDRTVTSTSPHRLEHGVHDNTSNPPRPVSGSAVLHSTRLQRQLSLLESVADESAKMSPLLAMKQVPPHPGTTDYPVPPSSVPPMDMGVIYASQPFHLTHTQLLPDVHRRPQTSHNTHRSMYPGPSSMSMNQSQLLALMKQPRAPEPLTPFPGPPAHFHLPSHGPHHSFASPFGPLNPAPVSNIPPPSAPLSTQPGSSFNIRPQPLPISPVGHLPVRNVTVNPRDASTLLSILNGTGSMSEPGHI
jgi:mRNA-decapping enzyme subunit 2